jgi:N-acetylglucosamine kinase-like BadF-type ATPase
MIKCKPLDNLSVKNGIKLSDVIAIIDSGSSKADWIFIQGKKITKLNTFGMNPFFKSEYEILSVLNNNVINHLPPSEVKEVFFYGAGCSGDEQKKIVSRAFEKVFTNAKMNVDIDIMGAVLSTCGNKPGISCIIGTGSNSVYFDGNDIHNNNYGLGYILGDEGAGTYLGKKLITSYLYGLLPKKLSEQFHNVYPLTRDEVISQVYNSTAPNAWLATFSKFYAANKNDPWIMKTIKEGFREFINLYVLNYKGYKDLPVHFVGSIAYFYQDILKETTGENKLILGKIIQKPIDGLAEYFMDGG